MDGKIAAAAYRDCTICTYNLLSNTRIYSYHVSGGRIVPPIWTHGESLRFVTIKPGSITIWEVEFTSIHTLAKVDSFPVPDNIDYGEEYYGRKCHDKETLFLPSLSRLAIAFRDIVLVWDAQDSKLLLNFLGNDQSTGMSFSPDGCFFACGTDGAGIHLWKDSPTGYTLHQKVKLAGYTFSRPLLSPNGDSIIAFNHSTLQLWRTADPTPFLSSVLTQPTKRRRAHFILKFSPDEILAMVVRLEENIVTVLDLRPGGPSLAVDAGMEVLDLRMTGSTTVILGTGKVATLNLGARAYALNARVKINHRVKIIRINLSEDTLHGLGVPLVSISPDLSRIAITEYSRVERSEVLNVYDAPTRKLLTGTATGGCMPWFTPNGREVWCLEDRTAKGWTIIEDRESNLTRLEPLGPTAPAGSDLYGYPIVGCWMRSIGRGVGGFLVCCIMTYQRL